MSVHWPSEFAFGITEIDESHREMFVRINQLVHACEQGKGIDQLESLLRYFQKELVTHFEVEEALMKACNYPDRQQHQRSHMDFLRKVRQLKLELESSNSRDEAVVALNEAAIEWLFDHVCMDDRALSDYVRSPRQAKVDAEIPFEPSMIPST